MCHSIGINFSCLLFPWTLFVHNWCPDMTFALKTSNPKIYLVHNLFLVFLAC